MGNDISSVHHEDLTLGSIPFKGRTDRLDASLVLAVRFGRKQGAPVDDARRTRPAGLFLGRFVSNAALVQCDPTAAVRRDRSGALLITDVGLPGGLNGRQMADQARVSRPELKVLFITGFAENAVLNHGHLEHGMHVLTKPFSMEALATRIKGLLDGS